MPDKILIVYAKSTAEIYNRQSALGSYIHCFAEILVKNGYSVRVNDIDFGTPPPPKAAPVNVSTSVIKKLIPAFIKEYLKDKRLFSALEEKYAQTDNGRSFDTVIEFYTYGSDLGYRLSEKYNKPFVLLYDNPVLEEHSFFNPGQLFFKKEIERRELNSLLQARSIVVYSNAVKEYLVKKTGRSLPCFIHQNVDFTRFEFIDDKKTGGTVNIGFIGSFLKWHRVDLLLQAFTRLREEGKNVKLFLLGNGMEFQQIKQLLDTNEFKADVIMPGFMDGEQLLNYKKQLHIGIMPGSNWYGAPNKIFEYGAAKMAVVAPGTPTIRDLFEDKKEVLLFKQDDVNDLYEKLKQYTGDAALTEAHALALQAKIRANYSENATFKFYNQFLKQTD